ncbi:hypothetical protein Q5P01_020863 [Channa striata]|uniref:Ig-like domain-containing protein n=1 Tax=Channa striata TaxID=64152 RepID=A0AA88LZ03_CHASR|nr:hypothetical protein Q5P01_020863 [Channa striata]
MTFIVFVFCFLHLPGLKGASDTKQAVQSPRDMIKRTGESVDREINCSNSIPNYDRILWYKQDKHKGFKLLGYLNLNFPNLEDDVKDKISLEGDGRTQSELTVSNLTLEDSGVYFCAASQHSAAHSPQVNAKTFICLTHHMFRLRHLQTAPISESQSL